MNEKNGVVNANETGKPSANNAVKAPSRRKFLGQVGAALTGGALFGKAVLASAQSDNTAALGNGVRTPASRGNPRLRRCFAIRLGTANDEARIPAAPQTTNGDEERYPDKCGSYSKAILQDGIGLVNLNAFQRFKRALNSENPVDFENITMGGTRTLNGPQGSLAVGLEGSDGVQFGNGAMSRQSRNDSNCPAGARSS